MPSNMPLHGHAARSNAPATSFEAKRKGSTASSLSTNSFSGLPEAERYQALNLQLNRNYGRMLAALDKYNKVKKSAPQQAAYTIYKIDAINKNLVCDGKTFAFKAFKGRGDMGILKMLASTTRLLPDNPEGIPDIDPDTKRLRKQCKAFDDTYNCVFVDAKGKPSLGYSSIE